MHHIYHTEGIILGSNNFGEAGKYYFIFTRELGMIAASAQGVRKMQSKLRFVLQDYSYIRADLVRGKDFWRLTSASKTSELDGLVRNFALLPIVSGISRLLRRLLAGEEANPELFDAVKEGFAVLEKTAEEKQNLSNAEAVIVLRILNHLGYVGESEALSSLVRSPLSGELLIEAGEHRAKMLTEINRALRETNL